MSTHLIVASMLAVAPPEADVAADEPSRAYEGPEAAETDRVGADTVDENADATTSPARTVKATASEATASDVAPTESAPASRRDRLRERWSDFEKVFAPTMLLEVDYRQRSHDAEGNSGFALARARLGMRLSPTAWMTAVGTAEFVGGDGPYLLDGFATFTPLRWLELTAGYSKAPLFASFRHEPVHSMPMPMRSAVVNEMRVRRDVGAEARFVPHRAPIEALVRLGNGAQGIGGNDNDTPTGYAALDLVLGRAWMSGRHRVVGLRLGAASLLDDAGEHESIAGRTPMGFTYTPPVPAQGLRNITTAHLIGYAGPVRAVFEGAWAYESRRDVDDDGDPMTAPIDADAVQSWGLTGELTWTIRGTWRQQGKQPKGPGDRGERWDGGAVELAARADRQWLGDGTSRIADTDATTGSLSLKWWPTYFLSLDLYGDATRFDVPPMQTPGRDWSWTALVRGSFFWRGRQ